MTRNLFRTRRSQGDHGAVLVVVAITMTSLISMAAFAVNLGSISLKRRDLQAVADAVALDMVRTLNGAAPSVEESEAEWGTQLTRSRNANNFPTGGDRLLTPDAGCYNPDTDVFTDTDAGCPVANAVRVVAADDVSEFFRFTNGTTSRRGIAQVGDTEEASFSIGSFLASLTPTSNTFLGEIIGSVVPGAELLSYQGLVNTNVTLGDLAAGFGFGSTDEMMNGTVSYQDLVLASIVALQADTEDQTAAIAVLNGLVSAASTIENIQLGDLFNADLSGGSPAGTAEVNVLDLLKSSVFLVEDEHFITLPGTTLGIPGVTSVTVDLTVIERPQIGFVPGQPTARTGQFELTITPEFSIDTSSVNQNLCALTSAVRDQLRSILAGVLNLVNLILCLLPDIKAISAEVAGTLPITLVLGAGEATIVDVDCPNNQLLIDPIIEAGTLTTNPSVTATVKVAGKPTLPVVGVDLIGTGAIPGENPPVQTFLNPAEFGPPPRHLGGGSLGLAGLIDFDASKVTVVGTQLAPLANLMLGPVETVVNTLLDQLDTLLISPLLTSLGLVIGGVDLTALSMECGFTTPLLAG